MTFEDIYELSEYIPENSRIFNVLELPYSDSNNSFETNRYAIGYRDLSFLWNFIKSFTDTHSLLPNDFTVFRKKEEYDLMLRVYNFERFNTKDRDVAFAIAIDRVLPPYQKNVIKACLLAEDYNLEEVANKLCLPKEVISIYEKLFFNVLDRMNEHSFIASLVYPESRVVEFDPNYVLRASYSSILRRSGYVNGVDDVLNMAGVRGYFAGGVTQAVVKDFENKMMCNALFLSKNGFLNSNHVGITNAKNLLAAAKHGGDNESGSSDDMLGAGSIGSNLLEEVIHVSMKDVDARRQYNIALNEPGA